MIWSLAMGGVIVVGILTAVLSTYHQALEIFLGNDNGNRNFTIYPPRPFGQDVAAVGYRKRQESSDIFGAGECDRILLQESHDRIPYVGCCTPYGLYSVYRYMSTSSMRMRTYSQSLGDSM